MITFKLPVAPYWYYQVYIFKTKNQKCAFCKEFTKENGGPQCRLPKSNRCKGVVRTAPTSKFPGRHGVIVFTQNSSKDIGLVTHELGHAITFWWDDVVRKLKNYKNSRNEVWYTSRVNENFCFTLGEMARQYWLRHRRTYQIHK